MIQKNTLCFSGPRTERLPKSAEEIHMLEIAVYNAIDEAIQQGVVNFLHGGCYGFDLLCAQQVLLRRKIIKSEDPNEIRLIAVIPFEEQAKKWRQSDRELYYNILEQCDETITFSQHYYSGCYFDRNQWMIDHSDQLICYHNGKSRGTCDTVHRAEKAALKIVNLYQPSSP